LRPPADLIKIDVEGAELAVLKGAERMLAARHPILFVALDGRQTRRECLTFLSKLGYDSFTLDGSPVSGEPDEIYALRRDPPVKTPVLSGRAETSTGELTFTLV
jgi:hypothetical protein